MPSFNPIDFEPEQIILTKPAGVPVIPNTENTTDTDTDATVPPTGDIPTNTSNIICPPREAPVVGTKVEGGKKKISGYEIQNNRCVTLYEDVPIINQVVAALPSTGAVNNYGIYCCCCDFIRPTCQTPSGFTSEGDKADDKDFNEEASEDEREASED